MSIRDLVQVSLLLGIGLILHLVIPGYGAGMKPDLLLSMLFIIIFLRRDFKVSLLAGAVAGLLCALTTTFPAGQIPNIVDKLLTSCFIYFVIKALAYIKLPKTISLGVVGVLGTIVSGSLFLLVALFLAGIPAPFNVLFVTVVLPATAINTIGILLLYPIVSFSQQMVNRVKPKAIE